MMTLRNILIIVIIGLTFPLYGQVNSNDTVFIERDSLLGTAQSIYFDSNRNSKFYDRINYWKFDHFDTVSYKYSIDYFKENNLILTETTPIIPLTKWVILKQYKGEYYVYHPCDFYSHYKASINDTTYIDWTGEGPVASKIIKQRKINSNTFKFKLTGINNKDRVLKIHIIDSNKGIAVFEEKNKGDVKRHYLMIAADKIRTVPLIVNNCETCKQAELRFDSDPQFEIPIFTPEIIDK
jgi:hypothetical protein